MYIVGYFIDYREVSLSYETVRQIGIGLTVLDVGIYRFNVATLFAIRITFPNPTIEWPKEISFFLLLLYKRIERGLPLEFLLTTLYSTSFQLTSFLILKQRI